MAASAVCMSDDWLRILKEDRNITLSAFCNCVRRLGTNMELTAKTTVAKEENEVLLR